MSENYIPLSQINTYVFCPRRFYYESVEGHQVVNEHVEEGKIKHARVDTEMKDRSERGAHVSRRQYLASETLGVSGYLDLIDRREKGSYVSCRIQEGGDGGLAQRPSPTLSTRDAH